MTFGQPQPIIWAAGFGWIVLATRNSMKTLIFCTATAMRNDTTTTGMAVAFTPITFPGALEC